MRQHRLAVGISQQALAEQVGIARQAIHAIETDRYLPNTLVALRLARALQCTVESLFALPEAPLRLAAELPADTPELADPRRVQIAQVGTRTMAYPLDGSAGALNAADGLATGVNPATTVDLLNRRSTLDQTVVVSGCDPALAILATHLRRQHAQVRLIWRPGNSMTALRSLARGEVHAAGIHLRDPHSGVSNLPFITQELAGRPITVVGLCDWQQGLLLAPGNPKQIVRPADLTRPDITITNRAPGAGSRLLLDAWLAKDGVPSARVRGYEREAASHFAVGEVIAAGAADAGPGILSAARAFGLDFLPLQEEPVDLVIPAAYLPAAAMQAVLDVAVSGPYRRELAALGGYDSRRTGTIVAELGS